MKAALKRVKCRGQREPRLGSVSPVSVPKVTRAENDTDSKSAYHKHGSADEVGEASSRITHDLTRDDEDEDVDTPMDAPSATKRKSKKSPKKPKKKKKMNGTSESEIGPNNEVTEVNGGDNEAKKEKKDKKKSKSKNLGVSIA